MGKYCILAEAAEEKRREAKLASAEERLKVGRRPSGVIQIICVCSDRHACVTQLANDGCHGTIVRHTCFLSNVQISDASHSRHAREGPVSERLVFEALFAKHRAWKTVRRSCCISCTTLNGAGQYGVVSRTH